MVPGGFEHLIETLARHISLLSYQVKLQERESTFPSTRSFQLQGRSVSSDGKFNIVIMFVDDAGELVLDKF